METQEIITNPESNPVSVKEQLRQEIEQTPDEILAIALEFLLFLKSRSSDSSIIVKPKPSTAASILNTLENIGQWQGDDFDECLELVHQSRSKFYIATDDNETEELK
ncbi:hypothetical protein AM228_01910 [Planktothricoides sp. SR001]|uniref:hypothetical protein n=1 Tax=Planktothricoides sp. SR001 TaxID=1705388 RepID=UPI0006C453FD|nr:hypothetical protein [Planktothricoides sp. SR001]KOR38345.1 hypothetical protein AM228_01910 [Planktothricoides sp. SR001]